MQKTNTKVLGKDLSKEAPRSPHVRLGGFVILARAIDKCRATIAGTSGEYNFDCPLDNTLFGFKGIKGSDFRKFVETGATDDEIVKWFKNNGIAKTDAEIQAWSKETENDNYSAKAPGKRTWLEGENTRLGLAKDGTLFDYLDAVEKMSTRFIRGSPSIP
jgi:hypothetical protein